MEGRKPFLWVGVAQKRRAILTDKLDATFTNFTKANFVKFVLNIFGVHHATSRRN